MSSSPTRTSAKAEMKPLRNISIISGGSRGDIQPYCSIALALERAGYSTRILTNEDHKPLVESFGLTHVHVFINNVEWLERDHAFRKSISDGDAAAMFAALSKANQEESEPMCKRFHKEMERHRRGSSSIGTPKSLWICRSSPSNCMRCLGKSEDPLACPRCRSGCTTSSFPWS